MIYIIRHGQTDLNNRNVLQGRSDFPLNDAGILQAQEAAKRLRGVCFSKVYTSPLKRAVQTAKIVVPGINPVMDERLIEMDYGPYEGADLNHLPQEIMTFFSVFAHNPAPDGMEQLLSVVERAGFYLEDLTPGSNGAYWSKYIGNCAVYKVEHRDGEFSILEEMQ